MKLLYLYIYKKCFTNTIITLLSFTFIFSIFIFLENITRVGIGSFTIINLIFYNIFEIPKLLYLVIPLGVLIGVIITLLTLVNYSEYAIIRTSGVSLNTISLILFYFGLTFAVLCLLIGEYLAPKASQFAQLYLLNKTTQNIATELKSGVWTKDGVDNFVNIKKVLTNNNLEAINIYSFNNQSNLKEHIQAENGIYDNLQNIWILKNVTVTNFTKENLIINKLSEYKWNTKITPSYFNVLVVPPEDMSLFDLFIYIKHLRKNSQSIQKYLVGFWSKFFYPFSCILMSLIAIAFIPNNKRNINLGAKLFIGILIGASFFFLIKITSFLSLLFELNAFLSDLFPLFILFIIAVYIILKKN